ncbi:MAG: hypothetical protein IT428_00535 [Planctomycetaceae bacterium]|nr:hypothetical protein [Planctomycetaceae bacterium]
MQSTHNSAGAFIAALLLVLIGGYVGVYYAMVERVGGIKYEGMGQVVRIDKPAYRAPIELLTTNKEIAWNGVCEAAFAPMHWLDRRLRPRLWRR